MTISYRRRADGRLFVLTRGVDPAGYGQMLVSAIQQKAEPVYVHVDLTNANLTEACERFGFVPEFMAKTFEVPFGSIPDQRRRCPSARFALVAADEIDPVALMDLDQELRQDVPGLDGWVNDAKAFATELASVEFDPSGYLVATDRISQQPMGLIRFWRHDIPRLGLLGVLPRYRSGFVASALLRAGLAGTSGWGSPTFETNTARPALQRRLLRMGAEQTGAFAQMVYRAR